jgi:hypothetical protein
VDEQVGIPLTRPQNQGVVYYRHYYSKCCLFLPLSRSKSFYLTQFIYARTMIRGRWIAAVAPWSPLRPERRLSSAAVFVRLVEVSFHVRSSRHLEAP